MVRGVVMKVYQPADPLLVAFRAKTKLLNPSITCDVLVYNEKEATTLRDVPIMRQSAGLVDNDTWVPRATTINLVGGLLIQDGNGPFIPTPIPPTTPDNMDGDHVLVGFMNNDLGQPVILGQLDHPRNVRTPIFAIPPDYKRKIAINGWMLGVTKAGNISIDGLLASAGVVTPTIPPVEVPAVPVAGSINIAMAPLTKLSVGLAIAPSTTQEPVILGRTFLTQLTASLTEISSALTALGMATPNTAALLSAISVSLGAGKPLLSTQVEVD